MAEETYELKQLLEQVEGFLTLEHDDALRALLDEQRASDIAQVAELLRQEDRRHLLDLLERPIRAEVLEKVDEATRHAIFDLYSEKELAHLVSELDFDDAADVLNEMEEEESEAVLEHLPVRDALQIRKLLKYSEDSAGGIMDPIVLSVSEDATVGEAVNKIRAAELDEDFYSVFVVNRLGQFLGDVRLRELLTRRENTLIKDLVETDTIYVHTDQDQEEVRNLFKKNDLIVVPVLDENNKLVGRITADIVIEVAEEEAAEDMYVMAGTDAAELESMSILHAARVRMTWLLPCLVGTGVTAIVMLAFKSAFNVAEIAVVYPVAAAFVPMIMAISGNAGLQTSAIVVCGLATGDLAALRVSQVFTREVRVALLVALSCGIVGGLICGFLTQSGILSELTHGQGLEGMAVGGHIQFISSFTVAMFMAIMVATTLGLFLPFLFRRVGIDPAIASGPLVTTANDSISVAIYLALTLGLIHSGA